MILIDIYLLVIASAILVVLFQVLKILNKMEQSNKELQAREYNQTVQEQKTKKPPLEAVKQKLRGRSVVETDDLVDMADLPWEDGYKAMEELGGE